tara:strand:- start:173 stop:1048 length:876 start_codon:yes stop_codon:yes gene_type:complete
VFKLLSKISKLKQVVIIIVFILVLAIVFETLQQLYYVKRYNIGNGIGFFDLLKGQTISWVVWIAFSVVLIWYINKTSFKNKITSSDFLKGTAVILGLVLLNIIFISCIQIIISQGSFKVNNLVNEYIPFYAFQKAPVYTLGYIAIAFIMHLYFNNEQLQIEVQELIDLKKNNTHLYNKLKQNNDDKTPILNIKIGNKRKIIPIENILWIEADDYCVKVHTINNTNYTMRSTLKALENKLNTSFLRVHRKAIVNMQMIKEVNLSNSPKLMLNNNVEVPISKSNIKRVKDFLI